jgi:hypothetical protein
MLEPGEYVVRRDAVSKYGTGTLDAINAGRFQEGGEVQDRIRAELVESQREYDKRYGLGDFSGRPFTHDIGSATYPSGIGPLGGGEAVLRKAKEREERRRQEDQEHEKLKQAAQRFVDCCGKLKTQAEVFRCLMVSGDPNAGKCDGNPDWKPYAASLKLPNIYGLAAGGMVGAFASLNKPIGFASGGCVGCGSALTERRFQAGGYAGSGLSAVAANVGGGGSSRGGHDVHLHLSDGTTFKVKAEEAVVTAMMRTSAIRRMTSAGRRSGSEG